MTPAVRFLAAIVALAVVGATAGLLLLTQPTTRITTMPAYCLGGQAAEPCRERDLRNKTVFRA